MNLTGIEVLCVEQEVIRGRFVESRFAGDSASIARSGNLSLYRLVVPSIRITEQSHRTTEDSFYALPRLRKFVSHALAPDVGEDWMSDRV